MARTGDVHRRPSLRVGEIYAMSVLEFFRSELVKLKRRVVALEGAPASSATWGGIGGTLSDQTDLNGALAGKSDSGHGHSGVYEPAITAGTTAQFLRGDKMWASPAQQVVFPLLFAADLINNSFADATTYYFGSGAGSTWTSTAATKQVLVPFDGTIDIAQVVINKHGNIGGRCKL